MRKLTVLFVIAALLVAVLPGAAQDEDLSGTTIHVFAAWVDETEVERVELGFDIFEEQTGASVEYTGSADFETLITTRVSAGDPPDVACFPQPGLMARFADDAIDLTTIMDEDYLRGQYDEAWLDMATVNGKLIGLWHRVTLKSLVWYSPSAFEAYGYEVPESWDELIALSDQMVADGNTPWYAPMESSAATGWVGTDWIEDIMLRTTSVDNYDAWTVPQYKGLERLPFISPEVKRAFELMGQIMLNPDYMYGGTEAILGDSFFNSGAPLIADPPNAFLVKQGSAMPQWLDPEPTVGADGDLMFFYFPPIDEEYGRPALVAGDVCAVFNDRPEVRAFAEFLASAEVLRPWVQAGGALSPHTDVDMDWYPDIDRLVADILAEATAFRFDGGDLMPAAVGTGSFWNGVVDYISGDDLDTVLEEIDAAWPED
jgi:alpha-glucoside transport system substrate-binding protein